MAHAARTRARWGAAALAMAPAVMLAGFLYHPHIGDPANADFLANLGAAVEADPVRWAVAHLLIAVGSGLIVLAFLALRARLRAAGEERWSAPAVPFVVLGGVLYALLPAMEFAPLAAGSGGDAAAAQGALLPWFAPTLFIGAAIFLIGAAGFAIAISRTGMGGPRLARPVAAAIILMAAARLVPLSSVQLHVQGVMGIAALWPLAWILWTRPETRSPRATAAAPARSLHRAEAAGAEL